MDDVVGEVEFLNLSSGSCHTFSIFIQDNQVKIKTRALPLCRIHRFSVLLQPHIDILRITYTGGASFQGRV